MTKAVKNEPLRIIYLEAENVKRLKAVRIRPDKTLVRIEGKNSAGKTSVLDAIAAALGGGKWQPDKPVRDGQRKAKCRLDLGEIQVERRWTAAGGTVLEVTSADGKPMRTPQAILDELVGGLTFDPLAFTFMKPSAQNDALRELVGLDFEAIDAEREKLYAERTVTNRAAKTAESRVGAMPPKTSGTQIDVTELVAKQQEAIDHNHHCDEVEAASLRAIEDHATIVVEADEHQKVIESETKRLREWIKAEEAKLQERLQVRTDQLQLKLNAAQTTETECVDAAKKVKRKEVADLAEEIADAEAANKAIRDREEWERRSTEAKTASAESGALTKRIDAIDEKKRTALQDAKFPVDGLSLGTDGPTLNEIPFSQASSAEQLRTSVAIGLASKPRARIMLCRDGSLLDESNMKLLHDIAEEHDAQVFVERVAELKNPSAVYIEDGEIVEDEA